MSLPKKGLLELIYAHHLIKINIKQARQLALLIRLKIIPFLLCVALHREIFTF